MKLNKRNLKFNSLLKKDHYVLIFDLFNLFSSANLEMLYFYKNESNSKKDCSAAVHNGCDSLSIRYRKNPADNTFYFVSDI